MAKSKYRNKKRVYKGMKFDSIKELKRYKDLEIMQMAGEISELETQPVFLLQPMFKYNGKTHRKISYKADFRYNIGDIVIVEDVKSVITAKEPLYKVKSKWFILKYIVPSQGKMKFFESN